MTASTQKGFSTKTKFLIVFGVILAIALLWGTLRVFGVSTMTIGRTLTTNQNLENGLVGHWTFDGTETSTTTANDRSGQGNHASLPAISDSQYSADAAAFDGSNDWLTRDADLTGAADGKEGTISFWLKYPSVPANINYIVGQTNGPHFSANLSGLSSSDGGGFIRVWGRDSGNTEVMYMTSSDLDALAGTWIHVIASWDLVAGTQYLYINDVNDTSIVTNSNTNIDYTRGNFNVGSNNTTGSNKLTGDLADLWFSYDYIDISSTTVRRKFITANGKPVDLGSDGSTPTGSAPALFLHLDDDESAANFASNAGTGGGMTVNGALATAATSPTEGSSALPVVPGRLGQALNFDGSSYYADAGDIGSGIKTIAFWIKADDTTSRKVINIDGTDQIELNSSNEIVATSFPGATIYIDGSTATSAVSTGWHHVTITDSTGVAPSTFQIGRVSTGYFDGQIDDVRTYNRVLSTAEIERLYELGATAKVGLTLTANPNLESDLIGHWTFDGPQMLQNVGDRSGQGNHGALSGQSSTSTVPGRLGQALSFDGTDDYVSIGDIGSGIKTIAFWIKADDTTSRKIIDIDGTDQIELNGSSQITATSFPGATIYVDGSQGTTISTGWHHVTITDSTGVAPSTFQIGRVSTGYFDGVIDDVRAYTKVLSASEISRLYELGAGRMTYNPPYIIDGAYFDGSNDYALRGSDLTSNSDGTTISMSAWFKIQGPDGTDMTIFDNESTRTQLRRRFDNGMRVTVVGSSEITIIDSASTYLASDTWHHILVSIDTNYTSGNKIIHMYIDGVDDKGSVTDASNAYNIDFTRTQWSLGANYAALGKWEGALADVWVAPNQFIDFSNAANRAKFRDGDGKPVNLGSDGSLPTGTAPGMFFHLDDGETADNFVTNAGSGGGFSLTGSLETATSSPTD